MVLEFWVFCRSWTGVFFFMKKTINWKGMAGHTHCFQRQNRYRLDKWGQEKPFTTCKAQFENEKILIKTILARNLLCIHSCFCHRYETESLAEGWEIGLDSEQLTIITQKKAKWVTRSTTLDAKTHCESRNADPQDFRTGENCQNSGYWANLYHQWFCCGWKMFHSFMRRMLRGKEFSKVKITSNSYQSREDRAGDRKSGSRICRRSGYGSARTVPTTRKCEVLGTYLTVCRAARTTIYSWRYRTPRFWSRAFASVLKHLATASTDARWAVTSKIQSHAEANGKSKEQRELWIQTHYQAFHEHITTRRLPWSWRSTTMDTHFDSLGRCWRLEQRRMDWRTRSFHR